MRRVVIEARLMLWYGFAHPGEHWRCSSVSRWRLLHALNPLVGISDGFRWTLLGGIRALDVAAPGLSLPAWPLLLAGALWYLRRTGRVFADVI